LNKKANFSLGDPYEINKTKEKEKTNIIQTFRSIDTETRNSRKEIAPFPSESNSSAILFAASP
jgi:hypothetical protein